jgi:hypothetical protein
VEAFADIAVFASALPAEITIVKKRANVFKQACFQTTVLHRRVFNSINKKGSG